MAFCLLILIIAKSVIGLFGMVLGVYTIYTIFSDSCV